MFLLIAGCVRTQDHGVTISSPSVPPSATEYIKDGLLAAKIRAQVVAVDIDAATHLGVVVRSGDVVLSGVVRTSAERSHIDTAVHKVSGVRQLHDDIRVDPRAASFSSGDLALAAHATAALAAQTGVNAARIRVSAQDGVITLRGRVPSASIETTAVDTVKHLSGAKRVVNELRVGK
ncbi:MAG: BON domain-containing protein [Polyangiaceae bacterium]